MADNPIVADVKKDGKGIAIVLGLLMVGAFFYFGNTQGVGTWIAPQTT